MEKKNLTEEEREYLENYIAQVRIGEMAQVQELINNCNITYQFAKTHSIYIKDWEKTKQVMPKPFFRVGVTHRNFFIPPPTNTVSQQGYPLFNH